MSRLPIRVRVTLAYAAVMAVVLGGVGLFLYLRLEAQLDESLDTGLRSRVTELAALARHSGGHLESTGSNPLMEQDESFAQILGPGGAVRDSTPQLGGTAVLDPSEVVQATTGPMFVHRDSVPGIEGAVRMLAAPVDVGGRTWVAVVGASVDDRDEALDNLARLLLIGGPIALLLASAAGYWLAAAALRPVTRCAAGRPRTRPPSPAPGSRCRPPRTSCDAWARL